MCDIHPSPPPPQVDSLEEADRRIDGLAASGALDPALLLMMAKAYAGTKDTDVTKDEVCPVCRWLAGWRGCCVRALRRWGMIVCAGEQFKSSPSPSTLPMCRALARPSSSLHQPGEGHHGPPLLQGQGELCAAGAERGAGGGGLCGCVAAFPSHSLPGRAAWWTDGRQSMALLAGGASTRAHCPLSRTLPSIHRSLRCPWVRACNAGAHPEVPADGGERGRPRRPAGPSL